jgi:hypothetical protein
MIEHFFKESLSSSLRRFISIIEKGEEQRGVIDITELKQEVTVIN